MSQRPLGSGIVRLCLAIFAMGFCALLIAQPAAAQDPVQIVQGRVQNRFVENGERVTEGVAGVRIVVETEGGEAIAEGVTDEDGRYRIEVPTAGAYVVRLDTESLPDELAVEDGEDTLPANLVAGGQVTRVFFLGESGRDIQGKWDLLPQTLANGVKLAMIIAITSIGLSLIYGTTGLSNFAHGEMVSFGALAAFVLNSNVGLHVIPAAGIALVLTAIAGGAFEAGVWRRLRHRGTSLTSMMVVSIGAALVFRYLYLYLGGGDLKAYSEFTLQTQSYGFGPIDFPPRTWFAMGISAVVILSVAAFLLRARFGKAIRAVSDNPSLASASGIDTDRVILVVWLLGGALAGLGGVLYGLEYSVRWDMGFTLLLLMFAAITLGGLGNPFGALVGALVIGLFVELWTWIVPNANDLKSVGALFGMILVLLVRPQGLLGQKERVG